MNSETNSELTLQERENQCFDRLLVAFGAEILNEKINRLESVRRYYRRWPYDGWSQRIGMDYVDLTMPGSPLEDIIAEEAHDELLEGLTKREREVARWAEMGYKPREMSAMR